MALSPFGEPSSHFCLCESFKSSIYLLLQWLEAPQGGGTVFSHSRFHLFCPIMFLLYISVRGGIALRDARIIRVSDVARI